ncbi:RNA 2',3'-cyclic phosphodiesterase [Microbispora sp. RL4-1S]|uniref:RNA 2',3'-cyclic phosphodiesterase n=1 Tax=Microbispora oryzae TaxID=2806554 RepID=A0A940WKJ0_9ACTN|nr:RNA 2',3'-cyclic phosphodiesterase [Microbispora oryzae]MBP2705587.1 RNA 2',3'-cyclic phosphodiesterase [Microbispora oryzae]
MSRLFAGLLPPGEALDEATLAVEAVRAEWPGLRWVDPALWHVTLAFFGEVADRALPDLRVRVARAAARHARASLRLAGAGAFPSAARGRIIWLGLRADPPLTRLAGSLTAAGRRAGAGEVDGKPFHPHLTLARSRDGGDLRRLIGALGAFEGRGWEAEAVHLVRSHTGPQVRYETVDVYPLGRRG